MKSRRVGRLVLVALGLCLVVGVLGALANGGKDGTSSGGTAASATARPVATVRPSGGLGLAVAEWEGLHGRPTDLGGLPSYERRKWLASSTSEQGLCWVERRYGENGPSLETARGEMAAVLPVDGVKVRTYSPEGRPEATVDLFRSDWLQGRFTDPVWIGGEPGEFAVLYKVFDGKVASALAACGNNP